MQPVYENLLMSSFLLWLDQRILDKGTAYTNYDSKLYPSNQTYQGYTQYNFPFSQLVSDFSISSAQIPTGLYLNSTFVPIGTSGLTTIDYNKGRAFFSTGLASSIQVSGRYAIKDINVIMPNVPDLKVLFETKMNLRPRAGTYVASTGINNDELAFPLVIIRNFGGENVPWQFGGVDNTKTNIGVFIFADSQFMLDATCGIIKDTFKEYVPLLDTNEFPFNNLGGFKNNVNYNYNTITANKVANGSGILIDNVSITDFTKRGLFMEVASLTSDCYFAVADFEMSKPRLT